MPQQVQDLIGFLDGTLPPTHPYVKVEGAARGETSPEIWLLGSSDYGGALAAQLGLRFAFAHFISAFGGEVVSRAYRQHFEPTQREPQPHSIVCVFVICAKTEAEAERLAASVDLRRLHMAKGIDAPGAERRGSPRVPLFAAGARRTSSSSARAWCTATRSRCARSCSR